MVTPLFLLLAALLAMLAGSIALWPLLRAGKRALFGVLAAIVVVATLGLYSWLGTPAALQAPLADAAPSSLEEAVEQLQAALREHPQRSEGWVLLGRSQLELGRSSEAAAAFEKAVKLQPDEPDLLVEAAQVRARANPKMQFDDTGLQWLQHARELAPDNQRAAWMIGIVQRQRGQAEAAAHTWEALLPRLDANAAAALREQIDAARSDAGLPALPAAEAAVRGAHAIDVRVTLAPALQARIDAGNDSLFVIARVPGGPPMPVAVQRHRAQAEPLRLTLDDADSPMPTQKLSALGQVEVFARLSASGNAMRQDGDIESMPVRITLPAAKPVEIVLGGQ